MVREEVSVCVYDVYESESRVGGGVKNEMPPLTRAYRGSTQNRNREAYRLLLEACCVTSLS